MNQRLLRRIAPALACLFFITGCGEGESTDAPPAAERAAPDGEEAHGHGDDHDHGHDHGTPPPWEQEEEAAPAMQPSTQPGGEAATQPAPEEATTQPDDLAAHKSEARASRWLDPSDREAYRLELGVKDHTGALLELGELVDRPTVISFIFTRCPMPEMCPLMTLKFADLQERLDAAGLEASVRLLLVTIDPGYDTPARLKAYGEARGIDLGGASNAAMLQPVGGDFPLLMDEFGLSVEYNAKGVPAIHAIDLFLLDGAGRFVRYYTGDVWDNDAVLADLKRLAAEDPVTPDQRGETGEGETGGPETDDDAGEVSGEPDARSLIK